MNNLFCFQIMFSKDCTTMFGEIAAHSLLSFPPPGGPISPSFKHCSVELMNPSSICAL